MRLARTGQARPCFENLFIFLTAIGAVMTVSGIGLWRMKAWGWWLTIISYLS